MYMHGYMYKHHLYTGACGDQKRELDFLEIASCCELSDVSARNLNPECQQEQQLLLIVEPSVLPLMV